MKVIVTGATGFIGRRLCKHLVKKNIDVVGLSRNAARAKRVLGNNVQALEWDGKTAQGWGHEADGAHGIVNLAGENIGAGRWTPQRKLELLDSRLDAARAVNDAIKQAGNKPGVLIQASGIGYYGDTQDRQVNESSKRGEGFLAALAHKWEKASEQVESLGVRRALLRTSVVLGPQGGALQKMLLPYRLFLGGPIGRGEQWFPWIHLDDEVRAITFLLTEKNAAGPFNLVAPGLVQQKEFSKALGKALGRPSWLPIPKFTLNLMMGEMVRELLFAGQRTTPDRLLELGFTFKFGELADALTACFLK